MSLVYSIMLTLYIMQCVDSQLAKFRYVAIKAFNHIRDYYQAKQVSLQTSHACLLHVSIKLGLANHACLVATITQLHYSITYEAIATQLYIFLICQGQNNGRQHVKTVASAVIYQLLIYKQLYVYYKYIYVTVWVAESQIHQQCTCSLCSTICHYNMYY